MPDYNFTDDGASILMVVSGKEHSLVKADIHDIEVDGNTFNFKEGDEQYSINFDINDTDPAAATAAIFRPLFEAFLDTASSSAITSVDIGAKSDASATTDTGTFSLIALFKRLLAKLTAGLQMGGWTASVAFSQTTNASAYEAGDCVGGLITLSNALRTPGTGILHSLLLRDNDNIKAALELLIFNANPTASTITDDTAFVLHANDKTKLIRRVSIAASDYITLSSVGIVDLRNIGGDVVPASGTTLYAALVLPAGSAPTYTSANSLTGNVGFLQD